MDDQPMLSSLDGAVIASQASKSARYCTAAREVGLKSSPKMRELG